MDRKIIRSFDRAANSYDKAADLQQRVAQKLVARATALCPTTILDIGCGTGLVTALAAEKYPRAHIAGIDTSAAMLAYARQKALNLITLQTDARDLKGDQKFDLIFSSMLLHWLPQPDQILQQWKSLLNPGGTLHVALPVAGSLSEWRTLCQTHHIGDGLWDFPDTAFAQNLSTASHREQETLTYENLHTFLSGLKQTGAHQSRSDHTPTPHMRKLIRAHRGPFTVSYDILYLTLSVP